MKTEFIVVLLLMLGNVHADVIMPDEHNVDHTLYIDNLDEYREYRFFIYPTHMTEDVNEGTAVMETPEIPNYYKFAGPHLYAVLKSDMENRTPEEYYQSAIKSEEGIQRIFTLPNSDPRTEIETHYTVSIEDGDLTLTKVSETDDNGNILTVRETDYTLTVIALGVGLLIGFLAGKKL